MLVKDIDELFFYDKEEKLNYLKIIKNDENITLTSYNDSDERTGYIDAVVNGDMVIINSIATFSKFRRKGIASNLIDILEFLVGENCLLCGSYYPFAITGDKTSDLSYDIKDKQARSFYGQKGYRIVAKEEFMKTPDNYPELNIDIFKMAYEISNYSLVYKQASANKYNIFKGYNDIAIFDNPNSICVELNKKTSQKIRFYDGSGKLNVASLVIKNNIVTISVNEDNFPKGIMEFIVHENSIFIGIILVSSYCKRCGIGTFLIDFLDYLLKDYENIYFYGKYMPANKYDGDAIDLAARDFYHKNGFEIISEEFYLQNKDTYSEIRVLFDKNNCPTYFPIIFKKNSKKEFYPFYEDNGSIEYSKVKKINFDTKI